MVLVDELGVLFISNGGIKKSSMPEARGSIFAYKFNPNNSRICETEPIKLEVLIMNDSLDMASDFQFLPAYILRNPSRH